jgi:hypothetical protein
LALGQLSTASQTERSDHDPGPIQPRSFGRHQVGSAVAHFMAAVQVRGDVFYLWPEHVPALRLWNELSTQWRVGMEGPTGLDYAAVEAFMRIDGPRGPERRERFAELRILEREALRVWADQRASKG